MIAFAVSLVDRIFVLGVLLRAWQPQIFSEWVLLLALAGLVTIAELGLNIYYGNRLQAAFARGDEVQFQRVIGVAVTCSFAVAMLALSVFSGVLFSGQMLPKLGVQELSSQEATTVLVFLSFAAASRIARGSVSQIFRGRRDFFVLLLLDSVVLAAAAFVSVVLGLAGGTPQQLAFSLLVCELVFGWGLMLLILRRRYPQISITPAIPSATELADILKQGKWLAIQQGAPVVSLHAPLLILGLVGVGGTPLVSFVVLRTLVNVARTMCTMFSISAGVEIAHAHHAARGGQVVESVNGVRLLLTVLTATFAGGILVFGDQVVSLWTARDDLFDLGVVAALLLGTTFAATSMPVASFLMLSQSSRVPALMQLAQIAIGLSLCGLLAPSLGILGAAVGIAVGEVFGSVVLMPLLLKGQLKELSGLGQQLSFALAGASAALWSGLCGLALLAVLGENGVFSVLAATTCWIVFGVLPPLWLSLPKKVRNWIRQKATP